MASALHSVMVYSDAAAGAWSAPIASNPYLNVDGSGWVAGPFTPGWSWSGGQLSGGTHLTRDAEAPVPRVAASLLRLRVTFSTTLRANVFWGVNLGTTPVAASQGPFWMPNDAVALWDARAELVPGTYTMESLFDPSTTDARYQYLGPYLQFAAGETARVDAIELAYAGGAGTDLSCLVDSVTIVHGRDDTGSQPGASSATIELTTDAANLLPPVVDVGATVVVSTSTERLVSQRFLGRITDVALGWEEAGEHTPDAGQAQIIAVGPLADLGRRVIGDEPWPAELDGVRVERALAAAGVVLDPLYSDPGTVTLLPRDVDSSDALQVAQDAAVNGSGVLYETRGGELRYSDAEHRRGIQPTLTLDSCDLLITPTWRRTIEGLVNEVSVGYGVAPDGGEQPRFTEEAPESVQKWGRYAYTTGTQLAALEDAQELGRLLLARNSSPVWVMAALPVDTGSLDPERYDALLSLDVHSLVTLTGLPSLGTAPTSASLWVEGWRETLAWGVHDCELVVSGYCRTSPPPRWDDLAPSWLWGGYEPVPPVELRRNLITDPRLVTAAGWSGVTAGGAITSAGPFSPNQPATAGQVWSVSVELTAPAGATLTGAIAAYPTAGGLFTISPDTTTPFSIPAGQTVRVANTNSIPAGQDGLRLYVSVSVSDGSAQIGRALMEQAPAAGTYFDGDTPDTTSASYAWTGAPNASPSTESSSVARRNLSTVPTAMDGWWSNDGAQWATANAQPVPAPHPLGITTCVLTTVTGAAGTGVLASLHTVDGLAGSPIVRGLGVWVWAWHATTVTLYLTDAPDYTSTPAPAQTWTYCRSPRTGSGYAIAIVALASGVTVAGDVCFLTGSIAEAATIPGTYFDGDTPDTTSTEYAWEGTPQLSSSTATPRSIIPGGLPPDLTWDQAACLGPPSNLGRWNDQPASQRWDQTPPETTWDIYAQTGAS